MGELLPFQLARLDSRYHQADPRSRPRHLPSHYLRHNLYATTSGVFSHAALLGAVHAIGADRLLFAVDYPTNRRPRQSSSSAQRRSPAPTSRASHTATRHTC